MRKSILEQYLITIIIVNENFEVIDGQHRLTVCQEEGLPVHYIVLKNYGLDEIHRYNSNAKTWGAEDYMQGYVNMGYKEYIVYQEFKEKYGFSHGECQLMLYNDKSGVTGNLFATGRFIVKDYAGACKKAESILKTAEFYKGWQRRAYIAAILQLMKVSKFSIDEFVKKLKTRQAEMVDCSTVSQYVDVIERIYNAQRSKVEKMNFKYELSLVA